MLNEMHELKDDAADAESGKTPHKSNQIVSLDESKYCHVDLPYPRLIARNEAQAEP